MNDSTPCTELDAMVNAFEEHPGQPAVDWDRYNEITELQEQRLYEEFSKPHNNPGNPACRIARALGNCSVRSLLRMS